MSLADIQTDGTCANDGCDEPTPFDMAGVVINGTLYCSPNCAADNLPDENSIEITVLDPQFALDKSSFDGVEGSDASFTTYVGGQKNGRAVLRKVRSSHPSKFRIAIND